MLQTGLSAGIPMISEDTCARILAVIHIHGENEAFTFCPKLHADLEYISKRFHVHGAGTPPLHFAHLVRDYSQELTEYERSHVYHGEAVFGKAYSPWAVSLFKERYGIKLIN